VTVTGKGARPLLVYPYGTRHTPEMIADLSRRAIEFRIQVLWMVYQHQTGHIGGAFSIAEVLTALYFHHLRLDPANPDWPDRDRLVFSKSHACAMPYTVMAHRGFFPVKEKCIPLSLSTWIASCKRPARRVLW
jgi:transketolase N-terminal domain/subunit